MQANRQVPEFSFTRLASACLIATLASLLVSGLWFGYGRFVVTWLRTHV